MWQAIDDPQNCRAIYVVEDELHQVTSDIGGFNRWLITWDYVTSDDHTELILHKLRKGLERSLRLREVRSVTWLTAGKEWEIGSV